MESHHIEHWVDGGETSLENLAKFCKFHHAQLHRGCFDVRVEPPVDDQCEAQLVFTTPSGRRIETDLSPQFPPQVAQTAKEALQHAASEVDATTCVTRWQGERCDYSITTFNGTSTTNDVIAGISLAGKVAVVTGGSAGLGIETARVLASAGAIVLLVARNREKLEPVLEYLREQVPGAQLESALMDLSDLDSAWGQPPRILRRAIRALTC